MTKARTISYRVEPGRLLAGEYPSERDAAAGRDKLRRICDAGIDFFLDLTEEGEGLRSYEADVKRLGLEYRRVQIRDLSCPSNEKMAEIMDANPGRSRKGGTCTCTPGAASVAPVLLSVLSRSLSRDDG